KGVVRYVPERVLFKGVELSQEELIAPGPERAQHSERTVDLAECGPVLFELLTDKRDMLYVKVAGGGGLRGWFRLEDGPFEVFKRGFKLCNTPVSSRLGIRGRLEG